MRKDLIEMIKKNRSLFFMWPTLSDKVAVRSIFCLGFALLLMQMLTACGSNSEQLRVSALEHFNRGNKYYEMNLLKQAASEYQLAITQDPAQETFHYNLGMVYYSLVLYDKAIEAYNAALRLNPNFSEAWYNLALAYEKRDDIEKAYWAYERYKRLSYQKKKLNLGKPTLKAGSKNPI